MMRGPMAFALASTAGWALAVGAAWRLRGRFYAIFAGVVLGLHTLISIGLYESLARFEPVLYWLQVAVYVHFISLVWARLRPWWWRAAISLPGLYFAGGTMLAMPWAVAASLGFGPWAPWLPYAVALVGVAEGVWTRRTVVDVTIDRYPVEGDRPRRHRGRGPRQERPLRLVQITDPHLGPWMSERRLRRICERAVAREPDLVLVTGDLTTMESNARPDALSRALAPLRAMEGRVFACRGNHDLEAPETVAVALESAGVRLLVDEAVELETEAGPVQILGIDHRWRGRRQHILETCDRYRRPAGALRIVLLHDPGAFKHVPDGDGDIVLSGHTHGGQVGLVTLGLPWTMLRLFSSMPDHGLWAHGTNRLYVHRGTGHYGFPLRVGVPAEESELRVHRPPSTASG
ncbi:MAG: metallophosphoesterase [Polyangiales bacterium]